MQASVCALKKNAAGFIHSCLAPCEVKTNRNTGLIRLIACLTMLMDHMGKMFFPQLPVMRLIGRLAFPLFAYGIAVGAVYTKDPVKYLSRVVLLALVSQPLYALGLAHENTAMYAVPFWRNPLLSSWTFYLNSWQKPSILLSLSLGLAIMLCLRGKKWILAAGLYILCERMTGKLDYGVAGIRLMLLFYLLCEHPALSFAVCTAYMLSWSAGSGYTFFGMSFGMRIFALPAILLTHLPMKTNLRLPRWFIYGFYPAHLIVLAILSH
ncbi:MAG: hypothetical protein J6K32_06975 [Clostridia bacterium]|nr:hypothetical protein [Clostridia bacterium]